MAQFPTGTYIFSDGTVPSGWAHNTTFGDRYILGATNSSQIGVTGGNTTHSHSGATLSSVAGHNHGGSKTATSGGSSNTQAVSGTGVSSGTGSHTHGADVAISNNLSHSHTVGATSSANNDVAHTVLMLLKKS